MRNYFWWGVWQWLTCPLFVILYFVIGLGGLIYWADRSESRSIDQSYSGIMQTARTREESLTVRLAWEAARRGRAQAAANGVAVGMAAGAIAGSRR